MSPYFWISCAAVLSPTPGTPGRLSEVSPLSATKFVHWAGVTSVLLDDRVGVVLRDVGDAASSHHHGHAVADELQHVPVAGHDDDLVALLLGLLRQRGEQVVGFEALQLDDRDPHGIEDVLDQRELLAEQVGRLAAVRLVLRVALVTERGTPLVEIQTATPSGRSSAMSLMSIEVKP